MLLSPKLTKMLNDQITHENNNEMKYRAVEAYFEQLQLHGFSSHFKKQADGEASHRAMIIQFMNDKNAVITYQNVSAYTDKFKSVKNIVDFYYDTEIGTTKKLYAIFSEANTEEDYSVVQFLLRDGGLIKEQIEEESSALDLQAKIYRVIGTDQQINGLSLEQLDKNLLEG